MLDNLYYYQGQLKYYNVKLQKGYINGHTIALLQFLQIVYKRDNVSIINQLR